MARDPIKPWTVEAQKYLYRDKWLRHRVDRCRTDRDILIESYHVMEAPDWVNVVAITDDLQILLVDEYRHGAGAVVRGLPSGTVETDDQDPRAAMQRELLEETGYGAAQIWPIVDGYSNSGRFNNRIWAFLAVGCRPVGEPVFDPGENISVVPVDLASCLQKLHFGSLQMQVAHLLSLFAAEAFIRQKPYPELTAIRAALV